MTFNPRSNSARERAIINSQDELERLIKELDVREQQELEMSRRFGKNPDEYMEGQPLYYWRKLCRIFKSKTDS